MIAGLPDWSVKSLLEEFANMGSTPMTLPFAAVMVAVVLGGVVMVNWWLVLVQSVMTRP